VTTLGELRAILDEVEGAGCCSHPVRLSGTRLDRSTGELFPSTIAVACKDRRAVICPACSRLYKADAWQLVAAGLRGGKGVPPSVVEHPQLFVTLTAPSFGAVHSRSRAVAPARPCHPRRGVSCCSHGVALSCMERHQLDERLLGDPLCPECFDYRRAVLWNAHVSLLWVRTTTAIMRELARESKITVRAMPGLLRLSYLKVVEFQRRGLVHLHVVVRADGPEGPQSAPPAWLGPEELSRAIEAAVDRVAVAVPGDRWRARWGREVDVKVLEHERGEDPEAVAAYLAKYATKTADDTVTLGRPIRLIGTIDSFGLRPHQCELVRTAWQLGAYPTLSGLHLRCHAHTFGYRGHFATKSRQFSTTFGALRGARSEYR
jgi:hypothetical protein